MKISLPPLHAPRSTLHAPRLRERGIAVISVLALVAIVLIYVAANIRTLNTLDGDLKVIERQQIRRLKTATQAAKTVSAANTTPEIQTAHE